MPTYLHHVTLTTGHVRRSVRAEISPEALAVCRQMLAAVRGGTEAVPIPGTDLLLSGDGTSRCILLTVDTPDDVGVLTIGIATHSRCGAREWRLLHDPLLGGGEHLATWGQPCPPEPWVAARLEAGATLLSPETLMLLGDLERCLGWAWIELVGERHAAAS